MFNEREKILINYKNIFEEYFNYLQFERNSANNTIESYIRDLKKLPEFLEINNSLVNYDEINQNHLSEFLKYIAVTGLSEKSQARLVSSLKSFFHFLFLNDKITNNPSKYLETPSLARKIPVILTIEEIELIINNIEGGSEFGHRNKTIIEILYGCGLRVSELTSLKISNIFFDEDIICVIGKGNKQRFVPIGTKAKNEILNYFESFRNHLNIAKGYEDILILNRRGKQMSRIQIFNIVKEACENAKIEKNISPHSFRHSFATHLIEGGADIRAVQEMLGHESITTTEIYTHIDIEYLRENIIQYHPRS